MPLRLVIHQVWLGCIVLQSLLALFLLVKKTWKTYLVFTVYVFFSLFEAVSLLVVAHNMQLYRSVFWVCETIGMVLSLAVVREVFASLFSPHPALRKLATLIFRGAVAALLTLAGAVIYAQSAGAGSFTNALLLADQAARIIEVGSIMFLFLSSSAFGLHWRQNLFGIALGLGMVTAVELITVSLIGRVPPSVMPVFNFVRVLAFGASLLIWLGYLLVPERATSSSAELPKQDQLEQWNQAVMELINR
jgi:hypothetical protein